MDDVLLKPPPDPRLKLAQSRTNLARRLNTLEAKFPEFAGMCAMWRKQLRLHEKLTRKMSPQMVERDGDGGYGS
jgi:hypothetical protein